MLHVRKEDQVVVLGGKDRGKKGRVLRVLPTKNRALVEGVNMIRKHTRPNPQKNIQGGILEREGSIHLSNLKVVCRECGEPSRVGFSRLADGKKVRVCKKCDGSIDK